MAIPAMTFLIRLLLFAYLLICGALVLLSNDIQKSRPVPAEHRVVYSKEQEPIKDKLIVTECSPQDPCEKDSKEFSW